MVLHLFSLLCFFALPMVVAGEKLCIVYTMIGQGSINGGEFSSEQWYRVHRYFDRNTNASIAAEGRKFLQFLRAWYGIDVVVGDDSLSGVDPTPVSFQTTSLNFTFAIMTLPQSAKFKLYTESRGKRVRFYATKIQSIGWMITIDNHFTVSEGRNQGMEVPARSTIKFEDVYMRPGPLGFDSEIKLRADDRVPTVRIPIPLGQYTNMTGYDVTQGEYDVFNRHVISLTRPEFGDGVAHGVLPLYVHGNEYLNDGRMVITFCNRTENDLP
ncbi:uncharacterized protein LOC106152604 [Lingula anatina]|uniref:Uncharacterized protein LOC106152604 n=1 Tax=Lingula anatina TaxID=7574 RepID=A0A1S3H6S8_LINAN|nr:uncharacterized protein LOC106152604 [Lingula anatina]|eukprot:XP_013381703.1 uncharacterized protein LOC106152604 [Lingula anatina]